MKRKDPIIRTPQEIEEVQNWAWKSIEKGASNYHGMTYEEGVRDALDWIIGNSNAKPGE